MDGYDHALIQKLHMLSGRYILGLALDRHGGSVYWLQKESDRLLLFRADRLLAGQDNKHLGSTMEKFMQFEGTTL